MTKVLKKKKLRKARKQAPLITVQPGQTVVVETLSTSSVADVVWQVREVSFQVLAAVLLMIQVFWDVTLFCWVSSFLIS
jgi:ubiquitin-conjugating enzyme E2 O